MRHLVCAKKKDACKVVFSVGSDTLERGGDSGLHFSDLGRLQCASVFELAARKLERLDNAGFIRRLLLLEADERSLELV